MTSVATKIKMTILLNAIKNSVIELTEEVNTATADDLFEKYEVDIQDETEEFRQSGIETGIYRNEILCRGYEDTQVAGQLCDGTWAGWTYYSGGGKHGDPYNIPWIESAYPLEVVKEEVVQIVKREFKITELMD